jgi:hypothetical protein
MELHNTSGQMGYAAQPAQHNMYNMLDEDDATKDSAGAITVASIAAAATTGSTLGNTYAASNMHPGVGMFDCWSQGIQPCKWKGNGHQ